MLPCVTHQFGKMIANHSFQSMSCLSVAPHIFPNLQYSTRRTICALVNAVSAIPRKTHTCSGNTLHPSINMSSSSAAEDVLFKDVDSKGVITLNRTKALNALTEAMVKEIYPVMKKWESEKNLVIIKGMFRVTYHYLVGNLCLWEISYLLYLAKVHEPHH